MINKYKQTVTIILLNTIYFVVGQSLQDLQKMRSEYEKFKENQDQIIQPLGKNPDIRTQSGLPSRTQFTPYVESRNTELENKKIKKYYGYDFFIQRDSVAFWENLPTPANYLLGPGDELIISIWGETQLRQKYIISREGKIYDEKVGLLNLSGRTIDEARDYLKVQFGRVYSTVNTKTPTSFMDVSIGELQSINVNFVGHLNYPGTYPIHPFSSVITGLIQVGGVDTTGSLRRIQIKRNNKDLVQIDLYDYFIKGDISSIVRLRDQDIILVPPRKSIVSIDSAVTRPGLYESILGETIYDMIQYAGGRTYDASEKIGLRRLKPKSERKNGFVYEGSYIDYDNAKLVPVNFGDNIILRRLFDESHHVEIIGQVKVPGRYHYYKGMTFRDLLDLGGGLADSTYIKSIFLEKAEIIRRNPNGRYDQMIAVDMNEVLNKNQKQQIPLQNLDRVVIYANKNFFEKENVLILGEVKVPGSYPIVSDNESLSSFIGRAGGLTSKALDNGIAIFRDKKYFEKSRSANNFLFDQQNRLNKINNSSNSNNPNNPNNIQNINNTNIAIEEENPKVRVGWQNKNFALMPGDSIVVKEKTATVFITGAVHNPGVVEFNKGKSLRYYINAAGGLTNLGNKKGIIILYANGIVNPKKWYNNPKVLDGSTIIINSREFYVPFNLTEFATDWASIASSLITAILLTRQM